MDRPGPPSIAVTLALVAGLAVAVGLTAGVVPADTTTDSPAADTATGESLVSPATAADEDPPYLSPSPETVTREEYTQPGIDVSAAAAADAQQLRGEHSAAAFEERFAAATNRSAFVESVLADIESRAQSLDDQHAQLLADYGNGQLSTGRLLRELVHLEADAAAQQRLASQVQTTVEAADDLERGQDSRNQSNALAVEIPALESPVTDRLVAGEFDPGTTVYALASTEALVLAAPNETHIHRQATLRSHRDRNGTNQFVEDAGDDEKPNGLALARADSLYGGDNVRGFFPPPSDATTVYGIQGEVVGGSFVAYLDGATKNIFHEQQTVVAADVPVTDTLTDTAGGLELTVNTTRATGAMRVSVTDGGEPVPDASLQIANQTVGTTGPDGQRWVVQPRGGKTVSVTVDNQTLSITLP